MNAVQLAASSTSKAGLGSPSVYAEAIRAEGAWNFDGVVNVGGGNRQREVYCVASDHHCRSIAVG